MPADDPARLPEGSLVLYRELYKIGVRTSLHGQTILSHSVGERYAATFADHDANGRAELNAQGVKTRAARKDVELGI